MKPHTALESILSRHGVVILDGGLATELERRGADLTGQLWSAKILLEQPKLIEQVHFDYFRAGADVAITASYQATFDGFARRGLEPEAAAHLMRLSVSLACDARDRYWDAAQDRERRCKPIVAASIGCYGASLADGSEYKGDYGLSHQALLNFHRPRLEILANSGADLIAFETVPCLVEAMAMAELMRDYSQICAWISFSCRNEREIANGEAFADCVSAIEESDQIVAVGLNCTAPRYVDRLLESASGLSHKPRVSYPNSGESWDASRREWIEDADDVDFARSAVSWFDRGARIIGGCCRTTPATIHAISVSLRSAAAARLGSA